MQNGQELNILTVGNFLLGLALYTYFYVNNFKTRDGQLKYIVYHA